MSTTGITTMNLRKSNRQKVFTLIYENRVLAKQNIANLLQMSMPTVTQNLADLEAMNLIARNGHFTSTGGRKAQMISIQENARIALGLEIRADRATLLAANLYGSILRQSVFPQAFDNSEAYFAKLGSFINGFISELSVAESTILGLGIVLQALISEDGMSTIYSKILNADTLDISVFSRNFKFPCKFYHDAESAALNELWECPSIQDCIFLNIRENLSGAVVIGGSFHKANMLKSGVFEHMTLIPGGKVCYCGKRGCMNVYCSTQGFLAPGESFEDFISKKENADPSAVERWNHFLEYLSKAIDNLHMVLGSNIILGGFVSEYISDQDLETLHQKILKCTAFPFDQQFIVRAKSTSIPSARGGALPYILNCINNLPDFT